MSDKILSNVSVVMNSGSTHWTVRMVITHIRVFQANQVSPFITRGEKWPVSKCE